MKIFNGFVSFFSTREQQPQTVVYGSDWVEESDSGRDFLNGGDGYDDWDDYDD